MKAARPLLGLFLPDAHGGGHLDGAVDHVAGAGHVSVVISCRIGRRRLPSGVH